MGNLFDAIKKRRHPLRDSSGTLTGCESLARNAYAKRRRYILLLFILLIGFALRLYRLGVDSLWYDETVSAFLSAESIPNLIVHTARDIHPPGYYLLLHFWTLAAGHSEFALAFFSLIFGTLLIPLTYRLAQQQRAQGPMLHGFPDRLLAVWAALLVATSPYHLWYSQEVRMYTLGAALSLIVGYCGLRALALIESPSACSGRFDKLRSKRLLWSGYVISAALGLYTLYYFTFLFIAINSIFFLYLLRPTINQARLRALILADVLVALTYLPWFPFAWRQITQPPVPPWRTLAGLTPWSVAVESWSALSLGQSVEPQTIWPILLFTLVLFILGLLYLSRFPFSFSGPRLLAPLFLFTYTFGPFLLIYLLSILTPLYHVRYLFIYSTAFYIVLAAGFVWLTTRRRVWIGIIAAGLFLVICFFSFYQYHFNPRYRPDDYRAAVSFIRRHWQPGDVIMVNAGYVYTAFLYYTDWPDLQRQRLVPAKFPVDSSRPLLLQTGVVNGSPQLGWGDPNSDFYAMSAVDTAAALETVSKKFSRLWLLRAYDTVADPNGFIRVWLSEHTTPLEDELFSGEGNIRAQGFLLPGATASKSLQEKNLAQFEDGLALAGWSMPNQTWQAGQVIPVKLWWLATRPPSIDYKMSLKLWTPNAKLAAQGEDTWPVGRLHRATTWPVGQLIYQADQLLLPANLPPGQYWLNIELYHPQTGLPLPRLDGADPVVMLGPVEVSN